MPCTYYYYYQKKKFQLTLVYGRYMAPAIAKVKQRGAWPVFGCVNPWPTLTCTQVDVYSLIAIATSE